MEKQKAETVLTWKTTVFVQIAYIFLASYSHMK